MIGSRGRLTDTAVAPLADNAELQLAAAALLEEAAAKSRGNADEVIARWEAVDAGKKKPWVKWLFIVVLAGLSTWAWTVAVREGVAWWRLDQVSVAHRYIYDDFAGDRQRLENCLPGGLTPLERMLLFGDTSKNTLSESMKGLWNSEPGNPTFFMEYAFAHLIEHRCLPPDFLETARRLAPENSWPVYFAAAGFSFKSVKADQQSMAERNQNIPRKWVVLDRADFDQRLALLHQAAALPEFDTYQPAMARMRMALLPMDDYLGCLTSFKIQWQETPRESLGGLINLVAAKAQLCAEQGDRDGFQSLLMDLAVVEKRWADSETDSILAELRMGAIFRSAIIDLHAAAENLGLHEESARFSAVLERYKQHRVRNYSQSPFNTLEPHYSMLLTEVRSGCQEIPHPPWTMEDLKPGRLADHEMVSRACCLVAWLVFGLSLGAVALFRFRLPVLLRRLSVRVGSLLLPVDFAWIIGLGILAPYAFTMFVNRLTQLGGRDWGILTTNGLLPTGQFLGMVLLMLIAPIVVARWRLGKRAACFGLGGGKAGLGGRAAVAAALCIPLVGWVVSHRYDVMYWWPPMAAMVAFPVFWLLFSALRALSGTEKMRLLTSGVIARALVPVYAVAMLLMAAAAPLHKAAERHWFQQDTILRMDPAFPALSPYEFKTARMLREQTRSMLGLES